MLNMILKMKFNFNMAIGYGLRPDGSTFKVTDPCDLHHAVAVKRALNGRMRTGEDPFIASSRMLFLRLTGGSA